MLALDSLVTDLIFRGDVPLEQAALLDALGGPEVAKQKKLLDPDMLDPRVEMELSPSIPFRRRGERRLMIIDDSQPLRADPQDPIVPVDLRPAKAALLALCQAVPVRLGRLFALGAWGDAVLIARTPRDLRAICLVSWVLDQTVDVDGRRRASPLARAEFEAKIMAYDKRLDELDDDAILACLPPDANLERHGDLLVVDVLEADGTWDQRRSLELEASLAALDQFSTLPGAPRPKAAPLAPPPPTPAAPPPAAAAPAPTVAEPAAGPPLTVAEVAGAVVLVFPAERFDLDVAAALGKRDWDHVVRSSDKLSGAVRDRLHAKGADWVAPLEFLSEVFLDGKPLSRPAFEAGARAVDGGVRALDVHFPRFGPVVLLDVPGRGRFVTSVTGHDAEVAALVQR
ncbi:MAG: hypothetical protein KBG48_21500 [Kofleriaceae bacterium]|nr:hypothetical protein [Kofleriaceae bacterium]MBP9169995.1 hypothetical protein [Kofleriaceae bacterium]MBP9863262.1 hypothetical protein [Kofleriaceae bacterium]